MRKSLLTVGAALLAGACIAFYVVSEYQQRDQPLVTEPEPEPEPPLIN